MQLLRHKFTVEQYHKMASSGILSDRDRLELIRGEIYAENNVTEVWLVDIIQQCVEIYRDPSLNSYRTVGKFGRGQTLSIQAFPDITITVDEILGI